MLVNLNKKFKELDGKEIENSSTMAFEFSRILAMSNSSQNFGIHPVRAIEIAKEFFTKGECDLDKGTVEQLKTFLEKQQLTNLAKVQLLNEFVE